MPHLLHHIARHQELCIPEIFRITPCVFILILKKRGQKIDYNIFCTSNITKEGVIEPYPPSFIGRMVYIKKIINYKLEKVINHKKNHL